jgi:hypothetical protein
MSATRPAVLVAALLSLASLGCGKPASDFGMVPVKGKLLVDGQPAEHAAVVLHRLDMDVFEKPAGTAGADGEFQLTTLKANDGAFPGEYAVTVSWAKPLTQSSDPDYGPELLPKKYQDPARSELKVTISEGETELPPIEIKTK